MPRPRRDSLFRDAWRPLPHVCELPFQLATSARHGRFFFGPRRSPLSQSFQSVQQSSALGGETVLDTYRSLGCHGSSDDALRLQFLEPLGEHTVGHAGNCIANVAEALSAIEELAHDRAGPALADELNGMRELWASHRVTLLRALGFHTPEYS